MVFIESKLLGMACRALVPSPGPRWPPPCHAPGPLALAHAGPSAWVTLRPPVPHNPQDSPEYFPPLAGLPLPSPGTEWLSSPPGSHDSCVELGSFVRPIGAKSCARHQGTVQGEQYRHPCCCCPRRPGGQVPPMCTEKSSGLQIVCAA